MFGSTFMHTARHEDNQISAMFAMVAAMVVFGALLTPFQLSTALVAAALAYALVLSSATRRLRAQPAAAVLATALITGTLIAAVLVVGWQLAKRGQR